MYDLRLHSFRRFAIYLSFAQMTSALLRVVVAPFHFSTLPYTPTATVCLFYSTTGVLRLLRFFFGDDADLVVRTSLSLPLLFRSSHCLRK